MNAWDFVTWLSSIMLATTAVVIFGFFLRDARSIFDREMHDQDKESKSASASGSAAGAARPSSPEDISR